MPDEITLTPLKLFLQKNWRIFVFITAICLGLSSIIAFQIEPTYNQTSIVEIGQYYESLPNDQARLATIESSDLAATKLKLIYEPIARQALPEKVGLAIDVNYKNVENVLHISSRGPNTDKPVIVTLHDHIISQLIKDQQHFLSTKNEELNLEIASIEILHKNKSKPENLNNLLSETANELDDTTAKIADLKLSADARIIESKALIDSINTKLSYLENQKKLIEEGRNLIPQNKLTLENQIDNLRSEITELKSRYNQLTGSSNKNNDPATLLLIKTQMLEIEKTLQEKELYFLQFENDKSLAFAEQESQYINNETRLTNQHRKVSNEIKSIKAENDIKLLNYKNRLDRLRTRESYLKSSHDLEISQLLNKISALKFYLNHNTPTKVIYTSEFQQSNIAKKLYILASGVIFGIMLSFFFSVVRN